MTASLRSSMIAELLTDYVEERVRQFPKAVFDLAEVKRSLRACLSRFNLRRLGLAWG